MEALLASPRLADLVLAVFAIEAIVVAWLWQTRRRGLSPAQFWPTAIAGVMLVIALRLALSGASGVAVAACLAVAGVAHAVDLAKRWRK